MTDLDGRIQALVERTPPVTAAEARARSRPVRRVARPDRRRRPAALALAAAVAVVVVVGVAVGVVGRDRHTGTVVTTGPAGSSTGGARTSSATRGEVTVTLRLDRTVVATESSLRGQVTIDNRGPAIRRRSVCIGLEPTLQLVPRGTTVHTPGPTACASAPGRSLIRTVRHGRTNIPVRAPTSAAGAEEADLVVFPSLFGLPVPRGIPVRVVTTGDVTTQVVPTVVAATAGDVVRATLVVTNHTHRRLVLRACRSDIAGEVGLEGATPATQGLGYSGSGVEGRCRTLLPPGVTRFALSIVTTDAPCVPSGPATSPGCEDHHVRAVPAGRYVTDSDLAGFPPGTAAPAPVTVTLTAP